MLNKKKTIPAAFMALFITISSCKNDKRHTGEDGDSAGLKIHFARFDKDLFAGDKKDATFIGGLRRQHGDFTDVVLKQVIGLHGGTDSLLAEEVNQYTSDKYIKEVYTETQKQFADTRWLEDGLAEALENYHELFPGKKVPSVKTFIAPFNYNTIALDSVLGIGLDMYLGADYKYYPTAGFPLYKIRKLRKEYIINDAIAAWLQSDYQLDDAHNDLLGNMIHEGKIIYAVSKILSEAEDSIRLGFSEKQLAWCDVNEGNIWRFFMEQKLLYSKNTGEFIKFINDGAGTSGFPKEAPARLGVYIGYRIVQSYMEKQDVSLPALMAQNDAGKILIESGYKPKK